MPTFIYTPAGSGGWCTRSGWVGAYRGRAGWVYQAVGCTYYQGWGFGCLSVQGLSRAVPGCPWPGLARPGPNLLRLSSHRILPLSSRVSTVRVFVFMNGAAPRSHFCGYPRAKYRFYFNLFNSLEDLTPWPTLAGKCLQSTKELVLRVRLMGPSVSSETGPRQA